MYRHKTAMLPCSKKLLDYHLQGRPVQQPFSENSPTPFSAISENQNHDRTTTLNDLLHPQPLLNNQSSSCMESTKHQRG